MKVPLDVLIIEDSQTDTKLVVRELRRSGYEPRWARVDTPEDLRAALQQRRWQVVISDSSAPRLNALQAFSLTKELLPGVPFVVVSGGGASEGDAAELIRSGVAAYLTKNELQRLGPVVARFSSARRGQIEAQDAERRRIARELHDQVGQLLTAIRLNLELAQRERGERQEGAIAEALALANQAVGQVRDFALELWPTILDELGLPAALRWLATRQKRWSGLQFSLDLDPVGTLAQEIEAAGFRIAQEALTNVARHAHAGTVWIRLRRSQDRLELVVRDDGRGFDVEDARRRADAGASLGLAGMQERASLAGGQLEIESGAGRGTRVRVRFPLRARRAP
jgi:two-component system sensor histidine kinase UhpB